jgi:hypothetical protein
MPRRQQHPTPPYKFRLLCKRCNSYMGTSIEWRGDHLWLECDHCNNTADDLDDVFKTELNNAQS